MTYSKEVSEKLRNVAWVILDEVHYLSDRDRGSVWEEVIINVPKSIGFVCLSATISNCDEFTEWLRERRGPVDLVTTEDRPVPLTHWHLVNDAKNDSLRARELLDENGTPNNAAAEYFSDKYLTGSGSFRYDGHYDEMVYRGDYRFSTPSPYDAVTALKTHRQLPVLDRKSVV